MNMTIHKNLGLWPICECLLRSLHKFKMLSYGFTSDQYLGMYVCNSGFHKAISCFFDRSGHSYHVKGAWSIHYVTVPKSLGQSLGPALAVTTPYITSPGGLRAGHGG